MRRNFTRSGIFCASGNESCGSKRNISERIIAVVSSSSIMTMAISLGSCFAFLNFCLMPSLTRLFRSFSFSILPPAIVNKQFFLNKNSSFTQTAGSKVWVGKPAESVFSHHAEFLIYLERGLFHFRENPVDV